MTTPQIAEALSLLAACEAEIAELRKKIEAIEAQGKGSLLEKVIGDDPFFNCQVEPFKSGTTARMYGEAFETMIALRQCDGSEAADSGRLQSLIRFDLNGLIDIRQTTGNIKLTDISPCFATRDDAQNAINTIGPDRIMRMFRTLHGLEGV